MSDTMSCAGQPRPSATDSSPDAGDTPLRGFQRKYLRGLAHGLDPVVLVGQEGITDAVLAAVDAALNQHELIKVRLRQPEDKKAMAATLAARTSSESCGLVGHMVILYRPDPEQPRIELPDR